LRTGSFCFSIIFYLVEVRDLGSASVNQFFKNNSKNSMNTQDMQCTCDSEVVDKDLTFMALTLASFAVALIAINTALLG